MKAVARIREEEEEGGIKVKSIWISATEPEASDELRNDNLIIGLSSAKCDHL